MKLMTARYGNKGVPKAGTPIVASRGFPRWVWYEVDGSLAEDLAPQGWLLGAKGEVLSQEDWATTYRKKLYAIGVAGFMELFMNVARAWDSKVLIICCYEDIRREGQWCHRRIFAEWWQEQTGDVVEELEETAPPREPQRKEEPVNPQMLLL